jgi:predicted nucleic acid-binding protein
MIVVADTTPLNYLALIGEIELLPALYRGVLVPQSVHLELQQGKTPPLVRSWASTLPAWCEVRFVTSAQAGLDRLDAGERDSIGLALEAGADTLLMDESEGRREALRRHLKVAGTLAILEKAAQRGLIDFRASLERLQGTNFRLSGSIRREFLNRNP